MFPVAAALIFYGMQHYLSLAGSLVFIPLIMVPAMGGTDVRLFPYSSSNLSNIMNLDD